MRRRRTSNNININFLSEDTPVKKGYGFVVFTNFMNVNQLVLIANNEWLKSN